VLKRCSTLGLAGVGSCTDRLIYFDEDSSGLNDEHNDPEICEPIQEGLPKSSIIWKAGQTKPMGCHFQLISQPKYLVSLEQGMYKVISNLSSSLNQD
jgi:hypothetical protein